MNTQKQKSILHFSNFNGAMSVLSATCTFIALYLDQPVLAAWCATVTGIYTATALNNAKKYKRNKKLSPDTLNKVKQAQQR